MQTTIERDELYEAIWKEPATTLATRYGITSVMLAKICRKLRVPSPPRGHWARKAAGYAVQRARLPRVLPGQKTVHVLVGAGSSPKLPLSPSVAAERRRGRIEVPETTSALHPLLQKYERRLRRRRDGTDLWSHTRCIAIDVSSTQLERALRVMHALLVALDERGVTAEVTKPEIDAKPPRAGATVLVVEGLRVRIGLVEEIRMVVPEHATHAAPGAWRAITDNRARAAAYAAELLAEQSRPAWVPPPAPIRTPTGELRLWIQSERHEHAVGRRQIRDTPTRRIEDRLNAFVVQLFGVVDSVRQIDERQAAAMRQREEDERHRVEEDRVRRARERVEQREARLREDLGRRVGAFDQVPRIGALIAAVEARADQTPSSIAWTTWARGRVLAVEEAALAVEGVWDTA